MQIPKTQNQTLTMDRPKQMLETIRPLKNILSQALLVYNLNLFICNEEILIVSTY